MGVKIDILNQRFKRWLVIGSTTVRSKDNHTQWLCRCDCGTEKLIRYGSLVSGLTYSCGCFKAERVKMISLKHGETGKGEYRNWQSMKSRCYNKNLKKFHLWGGKGVTVCERWLNSYENFIEDMGRKPTAKHTLDRYPNPNGNYEPSNVRWATQKQQGANRRDNHWIEYNGEKKILREWTTELGTSHGNFMRMAKSIGESNTILFYKTRNEQSSKTAI